MKHPALVAATLLLLAGCGGATDAGASSPTAASDPSSASTGSPTSSAASAGGTGSASASVTAGATPSATGSAPSASTRSTATASSRTPTTSPTPSRSRLGAQAPVPNAARRSGFLRALDMYAPDLRDEQSDARLVRVGAGLCMAWDDDVALSRTNALLEDEGYSQDESGALVAAAVTAICPQHEELVSE